MGEGLNLIYVGKASLSNTFGGRLNAYFGYEPDRSCRIKNIADWSEKPFYLITVAVLMDSPFESSSLEDFLLVRLGDKLPDNKQGSSSNITRN